LRASAQASPAAAAYWAHVVTPRKKKKKNITVCALLASCGSAFPAAAPATSRSISATSALWAGRRAAGVTPTARTRLRLTLRRCGEKQGAEARRTPQQWRK